MNPLAVWIEAHGGASAKRALVALVLERTGKSVRWATLHDIARGAVVPRADTARAIETATGGEVSAAALLGIEAPSPRKRRRQAGAAA